MNKPQIKKETAIDYYVKEANTIIFYTTPDTIKDISEFGNVCQSGNYRDRYSLVVDCRFDFDEVVAYIKSLGEK